MPSDVFTQLPFFQGLSAEQLALLRPLFTPCDYQAGETIFEQGDRAEYLYILVIGKVSIEFKPHDGPVLTIAHLKPGGVFGWSAALGSHAYTSGATSAQYTQLLRVRGTDLSGLCERNQTLSEIILNRLADVIAERIRSAHPQVIAMLESGLLNGAHKTGG
jgi:CRP-like cAMP-binding protein